MKKEEKIKFANKEIIELGNLDVIADIFTKNYTVHTTNKDYKGHDFIKRWAKQIRTAIPDIRLLAINFYIQTNDTVVWERILEGTHTNRMWGVRASGQRIRWKEMVVTRFYNDKIDEEWVVSELAGEMLGKVPKTT